MDSQTAATFLLLGDHIDATVQYLGVSTLAKEKTRTTKAVVRATNSRSGEITGRLGSTSRAFTHSQEALHAAFNCVKDDPEVRAKFQEWNTWLGTVYGRSPDSVDLFTKHTYLAMVSRAAVALAVFRDVRRDAALYRGLISGKFFRGHNVQNLGADCFSWGLDTPAQAAFLECFAHLFHQLDEFDWSRVDEDFLKMLYQELIHPDHRQLLGEFYTPDWLAELTLEEIGYKKGTLVDPACGSGTFLFCAIRRLRGGGLEGNELVQTALESLVGIDANPVAVLMARANMLLALAAEIPGYPHDIHLPVHLADTLMSGQDAVGRRHAITRNSKFRIPNYADGRLPRQKFDFVVGNPPWLSLRDVQDGGDKAKLKQLAFAYKLIEKTERKLFTQIDASTVFFAHSEHAFLGPGGTIAFVMPKPVILPAKQHLAFQRTGFTSIHEFSGVDRLFKLPTCVLIRNGLSATENIPITHWRGGLSRLQPNLPWAEARKTLQSSTGLLSFPTAGPARSPYYSQVFQGATLVPRCFWFVEAPVNRQSATPFLRTAKQIRASAKGQWKNLEIKGRVEKNFVFGTVLSEDVLPFVVRQLRPLVLPLGERDGRFLMMNPGDLVRDGAPLASVWVETAERIWEKRKKKDQPKIYEYINYDQKITGQNPAAEFIVLYNRSGTNLAAAYLTPAERTHAGLLPIRGFVADNVTYRYYADSEDHALYLVGVLNSSVVNAAIKPYQSQGQQGERDIHRRPFEVCAIPLFARKDQLHREIVRLARLARERMLERRSSIEGNTTRARRAARRAIQSELGILDGLVSRLLATYERVSTLKR